MLKRCESVGESKNSEDDVKMERGRGGRGKKAPEKGRD